MCVVALAWNAHPRWRVVLAGNRDEFHVRPAAALARWDTPQGLIAGRDLVGGGTWAGVSEAGRLAVIVNVRGGMPDPEKASRGELVTAALAGDFAADVSTFNPFAMVVADRGTARLVSNFPDPVTCQLGDGVHSLSNGLPGEPWPRRVKLEAAMSDWLGSNQAPETLFGDLRPRSALRHPRFDNHRGRRSWAWDCHRTSLRPRRDCIRSHRDPVRLAGPFVIADRAKRRF
jgi:uncharacterized protein with NRDE domain